MSVEAFLISELVAEGSLQKALQAGVDESSFDLCDEEWNWLVLQTEKKLAINTRRFKDKFPDFEFVQTGERIQDLIEDLKSERAYVSLCAAIEEAQNDLDHENALDKAISLREVLSDVVREHAPSGSVPIKKWEHHLQEQKSISILRESGQLVGIPTGLKNLDHHWGGLQPAFLYTVLGRPGDAKSMLLAKLTVEGMLDGRRIGFFSPEMNERQHRCRFSTLLSANPEIQEACNLKGAFRNRALMDGNGYNLKTYKRFLEFVEKEIPGEIELFTQKWRRTKMTVSYIESRIDDLGLEAVIVDPIYKLKSKTKGLAKHEQLNDIVDGLQDLSKAFNIPVVLSNQATRALVGTKGDAPTKDTSFGSDAPAQESDSVIGVKYYEDEHLMKLHCSKNRFGDPFRFSIAFWPNVGKMEDVTPLKGSYINGYDPEKAEELRLAMMENENA